MEGPPPNKDTWGAPLYVTGLRLTKPTGLGADESFSSRGGRVNDYNHSRSPKRVGCHPIGQPIRQGECFDVNRLTGQASKESPLLAEAEAVVTDDPCPFDPFLPEESFSRSQSQPKALV